MTEEKIELHVYDLSFGLTRHLSQNILGTRVEGVWHTGVHVFGYEYFFGHSIQRLTPQEFQQMFGRGPTKVLDCGNTTKTREQFEQFLHGEDMNEQFQTLNYHLVNNNCNDFSRACLTYLLGQGTELPDEVDNVLDNAHVIMGSPNSVIAQQALRQASEFGRSIFAALQREGRGVMAARGATTGSTSRNAAAAAGGDGEADSERSGSEGPGGIFSGVNPDLAISGLLSLFEGLQNVQRVQGLGDIESRARGVGALLNASGSRGRNSAPARSSSRGGDAAGVAGAANAAADFMSLAGNLMTGLQVMEGVQGLQRQLGQLVPNRGGQRPGPRVAPRQPVRGPPARNLVRTAAGFQGPPVPNIPPRVPNADIRANSSSRASEESVGEIGDGSNDFVPLRDDVKTFLQNVFPLEDEKKVQKSVSKIFEKEGYYSMEQLRGVSEDELVQMGVKRGWAKQVKRSLDTYFIEP